MKDLQAKGSRWMLILKEIALRQLRHARAIFRSYNYCTIMVLTLVSIQRREIQVCFRLLHTVIAKRLDFYWKSAK